MPIVFFKNNYVDPKQPTYSKKHGLKRGDDTSAYFGRVAAVIKQRETMLSTGTFKKEIGLGNVIGEYVFFFSHFCSHFFPFSHPACAIKLCLYNNSFFSLTSIVVNHAPAPLLFYFFFFFFSFFLFQLYAPLASSADS
jgi:hypothetical protein